MSDPVELVISTWLGWEQMPRSEHAVRNKLRALAAAGLDSIEAHERIAAARRDGLSIPDAVQAAMIEQGA